MRKMAIFTEGQTEQIFASALLREGVQDASLHIVSRKLHGGRRFPMVEILIGDDPPLMQPATHYVLIMDCASDGKVASTVCEQYARLIEEGFNWIVAVRDVAPDFIYEDRERLASGITRSLPQAPISPIVVLATMEVEAWFIAEVSHFSRLHSGLSVEFISSTGMSIDMSLERRPAPAEDLRLIYESHGLSYTKSKSDVERTVHALDMGIMRRDIPSITPSISSLVGALSDFFSDR